jgi:tetratricopeptide (TPR) repeat protein
MSPDRDLSWMSDRDKMFYWREVTAAQHALGDHRAELRTAREAERFDKNRLGIVYMHARALIGAGRSADALRGIENIELLDPDPVIVAAEIAWRMNPRHLATPGWVLHQLATELLAHQAGDHARAVLERADQWFRRRPAEEAARLEQRLTHARVLDALGSYDEAERLLQLIGVEDSVNLDYRGMLGVIAARRGNRREAQRIDQVLTGLTTHRPPGAPGLYRAQIAALLGDHTRALDLLEALPHRVHPADPLFFHSDPAFLVLHRNPRFQAFIRPRG